ncbi:hypothetical protein ACHAQA_003668 [Verticillium albo-atrum]
MEDEAAAANIGGRRSPSDLQQKTTPEKRKAVDSPTSKSTEQGLLTPVSQRRKRTKTSLNPGDDNPQTPDTAGTLLNAGSALFIPGKKRHGARRELGRHPRTFRPGGRAGFRGVTSNDNTPSESFELSWWPTPEQAAKPVPADLHSTMAARAAAATAAVAAASALGVIETPSVQPVPPVFGTAAPGFLFNPRLNSSSTLKGTKSATSKPPQCDLQLQPKQPESSSVTPVDVSQTATSSKLIPPASAPKGPAAWRVAKATDNRLIQQRANTTFPASLPSSSQQGHQTSASTTPPTALGPLRPIGTWSQSKAWVSERSRQQASFKKMKASLGRLNAGNSPALPETLAEFLELKKWKAEHDQKILRRKISLLERQQKPEIATDIAEEAEQEEITDENEEEANQVPGSVFNSSSGGCETDTLDESEWETEDEEDESLGRKPKTVVSKTTAVQGTNRDPAVNSTTPMLLGGKTFDDNLSPFFASDMCWNDKYTDSKSMPTEARVDWPSKTDFQEYGESRYQMGMRRTLPPPRENRLTSRLAGVVQNKNTSLHAHLKNIRLDRLSIASCDNVQEVLYSQAGRVQQHGTRARYDDAEVTKLLELPDWLCVAIDKARDFTMDP